MSRTDRLGDVVLTLPLLGLLRQRWPGAEILFLTRQYARPVAEACAHVHRVVEWPDHHAATAAARAALLRDTGADTLLHLFPRREVAIAGRDAGIARRIGTARRWYHWLTCTERVNVSRKRSALHEAQLNLLVAAPLLHQSRLSLAELVPHAGLTRAAPLDAAWASRIDPARCTVLVQPLTGGTVPAWPLERWTALARALDPSRFQLFVTGSADEGAQLREWLRSLPAHVEDATGQSLALLLSFTRAADCFVGASTGPLHIAAALGVPTIGLYPARESGLPARWEPLGARTTMLLQAPPPGGDHATLDISAIDVDEVRREVERVARER
ncbi:MAG: glycosyltransferase family 9 protein [Gemmatimonadetes bacterium]|nr:glycosyltransferase family 9 protein [Gemmatimonadota bacterium]